MLQNKNSNIMGPISKLWMTTEVGRQAKKFPVDLDATRGHVEKSGAFKGPSNGTLQEVQCLVSFELCTTKVKRDASSTPFGIMCQI